MGWVMIFQLLLGGFHIIFLLTLKFYLTRLLVQSNDVLGLRWYSQNITNKYHRKMRKICGFRLHFHALFSDFGINLHYILLSQNKIIFHLAQILSKIFSEGLVLRYFQRILHYAILLDSILTYFCAKSDIMHTLNILFLEYLLIC